jgi:hypothetical protein
MGYEGKGLGNKGQGIVNPIEVVQRPHYLGLGYTKEKIRAFPRWSPKHRKQVMIQMIIFFFFFKFKF